MLYKMETSPPLLGTLALRGKNTKDEWRERWDKRQISRGNNRKRRDEKVKKSGNGGHEKYGGKDGGRRRKV